MMFNIFLQVLKENNVRREELKARALALKILGKIFQVHYFSNLLRNLVLVIATIIGSEISLSESK